MSPLLCMCDCLCVHLCICVSEYLCRPLAHTWGASLRCLLTVLWEGIECQRLGGTPILSRTPWTCCRVLGTMYEGAGVSQTCGQWRVHTQAFGGSSPNTQPLPRSPPFLAGMGLEGAGLEETGLSLRAGSWIFLFCPDVS